MVPPTAGGARGCLATSPTVSRAACRCRLRAGTPSPAYAAVSARGEKLSCGVTTTGAAYCWGLNTHGELGIGTSTGPEQCLKGVLYDCSTVPVAVAGGLRFQQVDIGGQAACGLTATGIPYCWGDNEHNLLGAGTNTGPEQCVQDDGGGTYILPCITAPARLRYNFLLRLTSVSVGTDYACGLTASDNAACTPARSPTPIRPAARIRSGIAAGTHCFP